MDRPLGEVLEMALELKNEDRLSLTEALLASLDEVREPPFDPEWLVEAKRRCARLDAGLSTTRSVEEVRQRARQRLQELTGG